MLTDANFILEQPQSRLNPKNSVVQPWSNLDADQVDRLVSTFYIYLKLFTANLDILDQLPVGWPDNFRNALSSIRAELTNYLSVNEDGITTQHHGALGQVNNFVSYIHNNGLVSLLKGEAIIDRKIHKTIVAADRIIEIEPKIKRANEIAESLIESHQAVRDNEIEDLSNRFNQLARSYGKWWYYLFFIVGIGLLCFVAYKIYHYHSWNQYLSSMSYTQYLINKSITFLIPIVLAVFSVNQFLHFRKLKEFYEDKDSSLKIMRGLLQSFPELRTEIAEAATQKIFSEFREKGETKMTESTLLKLLEIAKKQ